MLIRLHEDKDELFPPTMNEIWRSMGWSEPEIQREALCFHIAELLRTPTRPAIAELQCRRGEALLDLTWTETFEAFFEVRCQELRMVRELSRDFGENDWKIRWATRETKRLVRRAYKACQEWLEESRSGFSGEVREAYVREVAGYWRNEAFMRRETTERGRQEAKRLQSKLDDDAKVVELRRRLRIPQGGFQDSDQAARWLYQRWPPRERHGPPAEVHYGDRGRDILVPGVMQVAVLAEATHRLRKKCQLDPQWDFVLCFYLLRGKLEPLPRKRRPRKRPKAERDAYLLDLMQRQIYRHTQIIHNYGLSEEEFLSILQAHPLASDDQLEVLCGKVAEEKGCWRDDFITYDNLRKIKSRWAESEMAL